MLSESRALRLAFTIASTSDCPPRPQLHHLSCAILPRHTSDSSCPDICLHPRLTFPSNPKPSSRVGVPSLTLSLLCTSKLGCYPSSRAPPRAATTHSRFPAAQATLWVTFLGPDPRTACLSGWHCGSPSRWWPTHLKWAVSWGVCCISGWLRLWWKEMQA